MFVSKDFREWLRFVGFCLTVAVVAGAVSWTVAGWRSIDSEAEMHVADLGLHVPTPRQAANELPASAVATPLIAPPGLASNRGSDLRTPRPQFHAVQQVNYVEPEEDYSRPRRLPIEVDDRMIPALVSTPVSARRGGLQERSSLQLNVPAQQSISQQTVYADSMAASQQSPRVANINRSMQGIALDRARVSGPIGLAGVEEELPRPRPQTGPQTGPPASQSVQMPGGAYAQPPAASHAVESPGFELLDPSVLTAPTNGAGNGTNGQDLDTALDGQPFLGNLPPASFPSPTELNETQQPNRQSNELVREKFSINTTQEEPREPVDDFSLDFSTIEESDNDSAQRVSEPNTRGQSVRAANGGIGELPPNASINVSNEYTGDDESEKSSRDLLLQSARNAVRLGDLDKASQRLTEYLRQYPDDGDARIEFASVLQKLGRFEAATKQLEHLMREFPNNYKFKRRYADLQLESKNYALAEPALRELLIHPEYRVDAAIDLARLLAWTQRHLEAAQIYDAYLANAYLNEKVTTARQGQLQLAQLLVEIKRPALAMDLLLKLHAADPVDLSVLKLMIMVSAKSDNSSATYEFIEKLRTVQPENVSARNELAKQLLDEGFHREAVMVDQQILDFDPKFSDALIRSAQASLRMFEPSAALATLKSIANPDETEVLLAKGEYHTLIGEYADAIAIYQRILALNPHSLKARIGLGHAYVRSGQFLRAAGEFGKVRSDAHCWGGPQEQLFISAQLAQARAYAHARRFEQAIAIIDQVMATDTGTYTDQILDAYVDVMTKAKRYGDVVSSIQSRLPDVVLRPHRERQLQARLGLAMARNREFSGALQEFESLETHESDPIPEAVYGKYLALRSLGSPQLAEESLNRHFGLLGSDTYLRVRIAELATEDCDCCLARRVLERLNRCCDQNVLIANRIGEACMMCASCEGMDCCAPYFQGVLVKSPTNVQAMLGLARIHTRQGNYEPAKCYFERAIATMSDDINLIREMARMYGEWRGPYASAAGLNQALGMTTGEELYDQAQATPERVMELEQEYERLSEQGAIISTESESLLLAGWKPLSQINALEGLFALEPTNTSSLFQIGQAYSHLNRTQDAICAYERVLCINPCHQEAKISIARARLEMCPQVHVHSRILHQRGRDDLTAMDAGFGGITAQWPLGDEDEFVQLGYEKSRHDPPFGRPLDGDTVSVRVQHKPTWCKQWWAQANYEQYDFGFDDRITFDIGWSHRYLENATYRLAARQENVIQNFESIDQDIHRIGVELGHLWQPTRRFSTDLFYRYWDYSDDNYAHNAGLYTGYVLRFGRQQIRWLTNVDWTDYDKQTILPNAPFVDGAIFPYFSPDQFFFLTGGFEVKRFLSCDTFKGSNRHWYEVFLGARMDNDSQTYVVGRGRLGHDIYNWLTLTGFVDVIQSPVYDLAQGGARLTMRF